MTISPVTVPQSIRRAHPRVSRPSRVRSSRDRRGNARSDSRSASESASWIRDGTSREPRAARETSRVPISRPYLILSTIRLIFHRGDVHTNTATEAGTCTAPARASSTRRGRSRGRRNNNGSHNTSSHTSTNATSHTRHTGCTE